MEPVGEPARTIFQGEIGGDRTFFATPNKMNPFNKKHTGFFGDFAVFPAGNAWIYSG